MESWRLPAGSPGPCTTQLLLCRGELCCWKRPARCGGCRGPGSGQSATPRMLKCYSGRTALGRLARAGLSTRAASFTSRASASSTTERPCCTSNPAQSPGPICLFGSSQCAAQGVSRVRLPPSGYQKLPPS